MTGEPTHSTSNIRYDTVLPTYINYHLKNEISIVLHFQQCSTHNTGVQISNCLKRAQSSHYETDIFVTKMLSYININYRLKGEASIVLHFQL